MQEYKRIPESEFEVMQVVWSRPSPISSIQVTELIQGAKKWKHQTVLTLLTRLTQKGYLISEKQGKDRFYIPAVARDEYLNRETGYFMQRFHKNSLVGMISALYSHSNPSEDEISELERWLKERREEDGACK